MYGNTSCSWFSNLILRQCDISVMDPKAKSTIKIERYLSNELRPSNRGFRNFLERSRITRAFLKILGVFGVSLIIADGVLTPAQSILGAIQGIEVVSTHLTYHTVVGVSCAILVLLFLVQPLGITKISSAWTPIVITWLMFNFCFGIYVRKPYSFRFAINIYRISYITIGQSSKPFHLTLPAIS